MCSSVRSFAGAFELIVFVSLELNFVRLSVRED